MEFALTIPALMFLLVGTINVFLAIYSDVNLHSATEQAARWASIQAAAGSTLPTTSSVNAYAQTAVYRSGHQRNYVLSTTGAVWRERQKRHRVFGQLDGHLSGVFRLRLNTLPPEGRWLASPARSSPSRS